MVRFLGRIHLIFVFYFNWSYFFRTTKAMFSISTAETVNDNNVLTANTRFLLKRFIFSLFRLLSIEQCDETQLYCPKMT